MWLRRCISNKCPLLQFFYVNIYTFMWRIYIVLWCKADFWIWNMLINLNSWITSWLATWPLILDINKPAQWDYTGLPARQTVDQISFFNALNTKNKTSFIPLVCCSNGRRLSGHISQHVTAESIDMACNDCQHFTKISSERIRKILFQFSLFHV